jgi:hypothetical protein
MIPNRVCCGSSQPKEWCPLNGHLVGSPGGAGTPRLAANAMMSTFQQHQKLIQKIAEHKYRAHQFDSSGKAIVDLEDLDSYPISGAPHLGRS